MFLPLTVAASSGEQLRAMLADVGDAIHDLLDCAAEFFRDRFSAEQCAKPEVRRRDDQSRAPSRTLALGELRADVQHAITARTIRHGCSRVKKTFCSKIPSADFCGSHCSTSFITGDN